MGLTAGSVKKTEVILPALLKLNHIFISSQISNEVCAACRDLKFCNRPNKKTVRLFFWGVIFQIIKGEIVRNFKPATRVNFISGEVCLIEIKCCLGSLSVRLLSHLHISISLSVLLDGSH